MSAKVASSKVRVLHPTKEASKPALKALKKPLPIEDLDRRAQLLDQYGIKKPLEINDAKSVLTIDPGVGATQVDTYATVPKGSNYDGLFVKLMQTDWSSARVEGPGVDEQMTVPPRTMAGAFGFWAAHNGAMTLAGKEYGHSELDRETGEVVLSDLGVDKEGRSVLETRRLRASAGTSTAGDMLTAMPPKVGLVGFPAEYKPEPALLAAQPKAEKLTPGATLHITGKSFEDVQAQVTSVVRPEKGAWTDPKGVDVELDTWLRVKNVDRAAIHHEAVVLRSAGSQKKSYYDDDEGPSTIHMTSLPKANLNVGPGETQEILVEKQKGRAHVEYRLDDSISSRQAGAGEQNSSESANRFVVLDSSKGKRHAGSLKFFDGVDEIGSANMKSATPGSVSTTSDSRSSGVTSKSKIVWSAPSATVAKQKSQSVSKEYSFSNLSQVAGQVKLSLEIESFSSTQSIKINGKTLNSSLTTPEFSAKLESETWGGGKIEITMPLAAGSEGSPASASLKVEIEGKFKVYED